jgi:hypothetical protein
VSANNSAVANSPSPAANAPQGSNQGQNAINDDPRVREDLKASGIGINKNVCPSPNATGCTTVGGLPPETISMLKSLKNDCGGTVIVSGGTEAGHSSHGPGLYPVDISLAIQDTTLEKCIRNFPPSNKNPRRTNSVYLCNAVYGKYGFTFCDEKGGDPHWHVFK